MLRNVLHIGAAYGEIEQYQSFGVKNLVYIEPDKKAFEGLKKNIKKYFDATPVDERMSITAIDKACSSTSNESVVLHANGMGQSSLNKPGWRTKDIVKNYPFEEYKVRTISFEDALALGSRFGGFDYICLDTQGHEYEILKSVKQSILSTQVPILDIEIMTDFEQYDINKDNWNSLIIHLLESGFEPIIHPQRFTESYLFLHSEFIDMNKEWLVNQIELIRNKLMYELLISKPINPMNTSRDINRYMSLGESDCLPFSHIPGSIHSSKLNEFRFELLASLASLASNGENRFTKLG